MNSEDIIKIPQYNPEMPEKLYKIMESLSISISFEEKTFYEDYDYRTRIFNKCFENVINSGTDIDKIKILYSLREHYHFFVDEDDDYFKLISSINDQSLIIEMSEYLDNVEQLEQVFNMLLGTISMTSKNIRQRRMGIKKAKFT